MLSGRPWYCGMTREGAPPVVAGECDGVVVMDIIVASGNPGKRREFEEIFALYGAGAGAGVRGIRLVSPSERGDIAVDETGRTYLANARLKARAYASQYTMPALGDDSGLCVAALGGGPGLHTARYGGPGLSAAERVALLLHELQDVPEEGRMAHFYCVLVLAWPDGRALEGRGVWRGRIAAAPRGQGGFGYDPVFSLPALGLTAAELPPEAKHALSHRGRAALGLLRALAASDRAG